MVQHGRERWRTLALVAHVRQRLTIERPIADVFAVLSDPTQTPRWSAPAEREWVTTPGPIGVGSRRRAVTRQGPFRTENEAEVTAYEPERRIALRSISGPMPFELTMEFRSLGATRSEVGFDWQFSPRGAVRLADPLLGALWRRSFGRDLRTLKRMLEAGEL